MSSIIDFYKKVVDSVGLSYDEENFIRMGADPKKASLFIHEGKTLVLPTDGHIKTATVIKESGEVDLVKIPFNPMNENVIRQDSATLVITKRAIEAKLALAISTAGSLLLTIAENDKLHDKVNLDVSKFLTSLSEGESGTLKKLVDRKSIDHWIKICNQAFSGETRIVSIFLAKGGKYKDIKYSRLAKLDLPLLDMISKATVDTPIYGVKLRAKDLKSFPLIFKFLMPDLADDNTLSIGSNDTESPAFIALMKTYVRASNWLNKIINDLSSINEEEVDMAKINLTITETELDNLEIYRADLKCIPGELDLTRAKPKPALVAPSTADLLRGVGGTSQISASNPFKQATGLVPNPLVEPKPKVTGNAEADLLAALYSGGQKPIHVVEHNPFIQQQSYGNPLMPNNNYGGFNQPNYNQFNAPTFGGNNNLFADPFNSMGNNGPRF